VQRVPINKSNITDDSNINIVPSISSSRSSSSSIPCQSVRVNLLFQYVLITALANCNNLMTDALLVAMNALCSTYHTLMSCVTACCSVLVVLV